LGLQKVIPAEDYAAMLRKFSRNVLVQRYVREWKASPEGVGKAAKMPSAAYEALVSLSAMWKSFFESSSKPFRPIGTITKFRSSSVAISAFSL